MNGFFSISKDRAKRRLAICLIALAFAALVTSPASGQLHKWSQGFGGTDNDSGWDVATDSNANAYVIGNFSGTIDFGGDPLYSDDNSQDIFLIKFDASGGLLWSKRIGDFCNDSGFGVCTDASGNVIITGRFCGSSIDFNENGVVDGNDPSSFGFGDMFVVKYNCSGTYQWHWVYSGASCLIDEGRSVCVDSNGDIWATGIEETDQNGGEIILAKLGGTDGVALYCKSFGGSGEDAGLSICAYGTDVTLTGYFEGSITFDEVNYLSSAGLKDIFMSTFDSYGNNIASLRYGNQLDEEGSSVCADPDGNVFLTGYIYTIVGYPVSFGGPNLESNGVKDIFLAKLSRGGTHFWSKGFGDVNDDEGKRVVVNDEGEILMTGYFTKSVDFGFEPIYANLNTTTPNAFLAKFDASGDNVWSRSFGKFNEEYGQSAALDPSGNVISTGYYNSSIASFGGDELPYYGGIDMYLAKHSGNDGIENVEVIRTFDPISYTWDAQINFETTEPLASTTPVYIHYDPLTCNDDPCWDYQAEGGTMGNTVHSITLENLGASVEYQFYISAYADGCWGGPGPAAPYLSRNWLKFKDTFTLTNSNPMIYDIYSSFIAMACKIRVIWYTKYPSKDNMLYYRKTGNSSWIPEDPFQDDCDEDRLYVAQFLVQEGTDYEFKISTKIEGVSYQSSILTRRSGRCEEGPIPIKFDRDRDLSAPFIEACPTPFNPTTTLVFNVPRPGEASLTIYAADGRVVKNLVSGFQEKGVNTVTWDGTNRIGAKVSSGVYFVKFTTASNTQTKKIILMR